MLSFVNNSETAVVIIHEIYGINENIKLKCSDLFSQGYDVFCPNLLGSDYCYNYNQEEDAYVNFIQFVGIEKSVEQIEPILRELRKKYKYLFIIGYSIGATISWLCSVLGYCDGIVCFYGSRIRDFVSINVRCPIALYFAKSEKSFDVEELIVELRRKQNIEVINIYNGEHGFADQYSEKFNLESYLKSYKDMTKFIEGIKSQNI